MTGKVTPKRLPSPRTLLGWDGTDFFALRVDDDHHLQIDVLSTVMDAAAATEATLASVDGYLGLLSVLWNCLRTVGTDRFMVKGEDQLFSFKGRLAVGTLSVVSGADGYVDSASPLDGEVWVVTTAAAHLQNRGASRIQMSNQRGADYVGFFDETRAFAAFERAVWQGMTILEHEDIIRAYLTGALVADEGNVDLTGYKMTVET